MGPWSRVAEMQAKFHRWAAADPGRRFDDLFNFVHDPATLLAALDRVAGNQGANTAGVDGLTVAIVETLVGAPGFLDDIRAQQHQQRHRPVPHGAQIGKERRDVVRLERLRQPTGLAHQTPRNWLANSTSPPGPARR